MSRSKSEEDGCLVAVILTIVALPLGVVMWGWATQLIWNWHATPLTATKLSLLDAIGLRLVVGIVLADPDTTNRINAIAQAVEAEAQLGVRLGLGFFMPAFFVGIAYVVLWLQGAA